MAPRKTNKQDETRLEEVISPVVVTEETTTETPKPKKAPKGVVSASKAPKEAKPAVQKTPKAPKPEAAPLPRGVIEKPAGIMVPDESTTLTFVVVCEQDGYKGVVKSLVIPCTVQVSPIDGAPYVWAHPTSARAGHVWNRRDHRSNELIGWEFATLESAQKVGEWSDRVMLARQDLVGVLALDFHRKMLVGELGDHETARKALDFVVTWARNSPSLEPSKSWEGDYQKSVCPPGMKWSEITVGTATDDGKITAVINAWSLYEVTAKKEDRESAIKAINEKITALLTPWGCSTVERLHNYGLSIDDEVTDYVTKGINPWVEALTAPVEVAPKVITTEPKPEPKPVKKPKKAA